jgi:hypothetical protein
VVLYNTPKAPTDNNLSLDWLNNILAKPVPEK